MIGSFAASALMFRRVGRFEIVSQQERSVAHPARTAQLVLPRADRMNSRRVWTMVLPLARRAGPRTTKKSGPPLSTSGFAASRPPKSRAACTVQDDDASHRSATVALSLHRRADRPPNTGFKCRYTNRNTLHRA